MFVRIAQRKPPRLWAMVALWAALVASIVLGAALVVATVADSPTAAGCDIQVQTKNDTDVCTTTAGAVIRYIGDSQETFGSSGTGTFNPFVRLQGSPTEDGYNTNGTVEFETKTGNWTHAILVSEIPVRTEDGCVDCWELWVDINDANNQKPISLNDVEIYFTTDPLLTGYSFGLTPEYDFQGDILIRDVNQGSGRGDLRYMVPRTGIAVPANCNYGNPACTTYFLLYSQWGVSPSGFPSDGGFEEWKVKVYPPPTTLATQVMNTNGTPETANDTPIADGGSVPIGTGVYDTATLSLQTADAGGTVSYFRKLQAGGSPDCTGGTLIGAAVNVVNGVIPPSATITLSAAGTYEFWAVYSGDANNTSSTSPCGSETVVVTPNAPAPHSTPVVQIKDTLTVSGFTSDVTGNVLVGLYTSSDCLTGQIGSNASFAASSFLGGATQETTFQGALAGSYYWLISYAGDSNNTGFSSCAESVTIGITSLP